MAKSIQEKAISLPFSIDDFGGVSISVSQPKIWADKVRSVVGTTLTERVMRYEFGTEIPTAIFETQETMAETIQTEIARAFSTFLQNLELQEVTTDFDEYQNLITATVSYSLPNNDTAEVSVGVATIYPDKPLNEVLR